MNLGQGIIYVRTARNMSQKELSRRANISPTYLCQIETGDKEPSMKMLKNIAEKLGNIPLPVIFWFAIDEKDHGRFELVAIFKKAVDGLISTMYL